MAAGGHHALDPFVALSFAAAATRAIRLQTNVLVLPYRNPFLAARSDFYFITPGLRPIRLALAAARHLAWVTRRNLAIATLYNVATVTLAVLGVMSPLLCAVVMPVSSLSIVLATSFSLSARSQLWKS